MKTLLLLATIIAMNCGPAVFRAKCQATNTVKAADDDLPPEVLMDQYLQEAQTAYKAEKWDEAVEQYAKVMALKTEPPVEAHYEYAVCLNKHWCDPNPSLVEIKKYLKAAGRNGVNYQTALTLFTRAKEDAKNWQEAQKYAAKNEDFINSLFSVNRSPDKKDYFGSVTEEPGNLAITAQSSGQINSSSVCGRIELEKSHCSHNTEIVTVKTIVVYPSQIAQVALGDIKLSDKWDKEDKDKCQYVTFRFKKMLRQNTLVRENGHESFSNDLVSEMTIPLYCDRTGSAESTAHDYNKLMAALQDLIKQVKAIDEQEAAKAGTDNK